MASVSVDIGASAVMASANSSAALGTIVTDKKLAQVTINESDIVKIHLGQKATMTFDAIGGLQLTGDVVEVNTLGTVTSGVVTYKVKVAFSTNDPRILPNMSVSVDIITDSKDNVLYVPSQAVKHDANGYYVEKDNSLGAMGNASSTRRFNNASSTSLSPSPLNASSSYRGGTMASSTRVRTTRASGTIASAPTTATTLLTRIPVTIGTQNDTQTEITSGLSEGERIILKKTTTTVTGSTKSTAPSVTSLLRPQGAGRATGATGGMPRG